MVLVVSPEEAVKSTLVSWASFGPLLSQSVGAFGRLDGQLWTQPSGTGSLQTFLDEAGRELRSE